MDPSLSNSTPMDLLNATEDSSPCNSTPINLLCARDRLRLEQVERATARLQCWCQREQKRRQSEQTEIRLAGRDRRQIHGEESSFAVDPLARSYIVRGPLCQLALNIKNLNFDITHQ